MPTIDQQKAKKIETEGQNLMEDETIEYGPNELNSVVWSAKNIVRIESMPSYRNPEDDIRVAQYQNGEPVALHKYDDYKDWFAIVAKKTGEEGVVFNRFRVVSKELGPYEKWEIGLIFREFNAPSGEDVRIIIRENHPELAKIKDLYILDPGTDKARVAYLNYGPNGEYYGLIEHTNPATIIRHEALVSELFAASIPLKEYLKKMSSQPLIVDM